MTHTPLSLAVTKAMPLARARLERVETTIRNVLGVELVGDESEGFSMDDYQVVLSPARPFVLLVPIEPSDIPAQWARMLEGAQ